VVNSPSKCNITYGLSGRAAVDRGFPDRTVEGAPMKHYVQLTQEQRYQIDVYRKARMDQIETAEQLEVDRSTISREIRRNLGWRGY
jgi:retron-type reverse transcriptase